MDLRYSSDAVLKFNGSQIYGKGEYIPGTVATFWSAKTLGDCPEIPESVEEHIFGLKECKEFLSNNILGPLRASIHFTIGGGRWIFPRSMMFYGAEGSGKKLLIRTFCKANNINLIHINYAGFEAGEQLDTIYQVASQHEPCIIMYEECDGFFRTHCNPKDIFAYKRNSDNLNNGNLRVWEIFVNIDVPRPHADDPRIRIHHTLYEKLAGNTRWSGDTENECIITFEETIGMLGKAISSKLEQNSLPPIDKKQMRHIAGFCAYCTPGNIQSYIDRVWFQHIADMSWNYLLTLSRGAPETLPQFETFEKCLYNSDMGPKITTFDPFENNVQRYGNFSRRF